MEKLVITILLCLWVYYSVNWSSVIDGFEWCSPCVKPVLPPKKEQEINERSQADLIYSSKLDGDVMLTFYIYTLCTKCLLLSCKTVISLSLSLSLSLTRACAHTHTQSTHRGVPYFKIKMRFIHYISF